jgi:hypothetical protein
MRVLDHPFVRSPFSSVALGRTLMLISVACGSAWAADDHPNTVDFYSSFGVTVAPDVEETAKGPSGTSEYVWRDPEDSIGYRFSLGHLICTGGPTGGSAIGVELVGSMTDITPNSYDTGGLSFANTSGNSLNYTTAGVLLHYGYQFGADPEADEIDAFMYLAPFIGGGAAWADSEFRNGSSYDRKSGLGYYIEGGLRLGFAIEEKHFLLGIVVDGVIGTSQVKIDYGGGRSSELTLDRLGVGGSVILGYRL